jgi:hypothetical protein
LHAGVPVNPDLAGEFRQGEEIGGFRAPSREAAVPFGRTGLRRGWALQNAEPRWPSKFKL